MLQLILHPLSFSAPLSKMEAAGVLCVSCAAIVWSLSLSLG